MRIVRGFTSVMILILGLSRCAILPGTQVSRIEDNIDGVWYGTLDGEEVRFQLVLGSPDIGRLGVLIGDERFTLYNIREKRNEDILLLDLGIEDEVYFKTHPAFRAYPRRTPDLNAQRIVARCGIDQIEFQYIIPSWKDPLSVHPEPFRVRLTRSRVIGRNPALLDSFMQYHDSSQREKSLLSLLRAKIGTGWSVRWNYDVNGPGGLEGTVNLGRALSPSDYSGCDDLLVELGELLSLCGIDSSSLRRRYPRRWFDEGKCTYDQVYSGIMVYTRGDIPAVRITIVPTEIRHTYRIMINS